MYLTQVNNNTKCSHFHSLCTRSAFMSFPQRWRRTMKNQQNNLCIYFYMEDLCLMSQYTYYRLHRIVFSLSISLSLSLFLSHPCSLSVCPFVLRRTPCNAIAKRINIFSLAGTHFPGKLARTHVRNSSK